jgi:hypothetical protein
MVFFLPIFDHPFKPKIRATGSSEKKYEYGAAILLAATRKQAAGTLAGGWSGRAGD